MPIRTIPKEVDEGKNKDQPATPRMPRGVDESGMDDAGSSSDQILRADQSA